jgi:hypothetical protein
LRCKVQLRGLELVVSLQILQGERETLSLLYQKVLLLSQLGQLGLVKVL